MAMTTTTLPTAAAAEAMVTTKHAKLMGRGNQIRNSGGETSRAAARTSQEELGSVGAARKE